MMMFPRLKRWLRIGGPRLPILGLVLCRPALLCALCLPLSASTNDFDATSASFEDLVLHAQRYGTTKEKKQKRQSARDELFARGETSLHSLMQHVHIENSSFVMLVDNFVRHKKLDDEKTAAILVDYIGSEEAHTRKLAAYFLGYCETPQYADRVIMLLDDENVAGAAMRTLGKWKAIAVAPRAAGFLDHPSERRRVLAVNALREMHALAYAPELISALNDVFFTVRKAAAEALVSFGPSIEATVLCELSLSRGLARRELIRILGEIGSRKSRGRLRALSVDPNSAVREDALQALSAISRRAKS